MYPLGNPTCLFCKIVDKQIPSKTIYEDEQAIAFFDVNPKAPLHLLIIPRKHIVSLAEMKEADQPTISHLFGIAIALAEKQGVSQAGFRTVINTGADGGQTVFHLHLHLMAGRPFSWPPG